jgi:hypothetical protein
MKKVFITGAAMLLMLVGCKKEETLLTNSNNHRNGSSQIDYCGTPQQVNLLAGQTINVGSVTVGNDATNLYVTYTTTGSWYLTELHLYVGDCRAMPVNKSGNPVPGQFPNKATFSSPNYSQQYTFVLPLSSLPDCYCVAAHAAVIKKGTNGQVTQGETAWGEGTRFVSKGNWGMYFNACETPCQPEGEGCGYRRPYWFNGQNTWPGGQVTVGGHTYTEQEGLALWADYAGGNVSESAYVFFQLVSIELSGNSVGSGASILGDVQTGESWLSSLPKLTPGSSYTGNQAAYDAASNIENWLDEHDCTN